MHKVVVMTAMTGCRYNTKILLYTLCPVLQLKLEKGHHACDQTLQEWQTMTHIPGHAVRLP